MNRCIGILLTLAFLAINASSQEANRDQKIRKIFELQSQLSALGVEILEPDAADVATASGQGGTALRLLPREQYEGVVPPRGGGSYYSFVRKTHEYGQGSDISLERNQLRVGFAGADYGFIVGLGNVPLTSINLGMPEIGFVAAYRPPTRMTDIRAEQGKTSNYETPGGTLRNTIPAVIGQAYVIRSISFDRSDILVAIRVLRKDTDGSLILIWKPLKSFEKPVIERTSEVTP